MDPNNKDLETATVEIQIEPNLSISNDKAFLIEDILPQGGPNSTQTVGIKIMKKFWLGLKFATVLIALVSNNRV